MRLHGADVDGCSGKAPGVVLGLPRRVWMQIDVAVSGDALWCTDVCTIVVNNFVSLIPVHGNAEGTSVQPDGRATRLFLDFHHMLVTAAVKHGVAG